MPELGEEIQQMADRLKTIMKAVGYETPAKLAAALGYVRPDNIYNAISGERMPGIPLLVDLSNKFENVNINWLLTGKGAMIIGEKYKPSNQLPPAKVDPTKEIQALSKRLDSMEGLMKTIADKLTGLPPGDRRKAASVGGGKRAASEELADPKGRAVLKYGSSGHKAKRK